MSSSLIVEICRIDDIHLHPNADRLEIVKVKGWECVTQKGLYSEGDLVVYVPVDSLVPQTLSDEMDVTKYLGKNGRVKTTKLRGCYSQGLLVPTDRLPPNVPKSVGVNVSQVLGITKYEPPPRSSFNRGNMIAEHPQFYRYTRIENFNNFPDWFEEGEKVVITEKIHGTNIRIANIDNKILVGSHNRNREDSKECTYWRAAHLLDLESLDEGFILYGEVYGMGIQKLQYNTKSFQIRLFDIFNIRELRYLDFEEFLEFCNVRCYPIVPLVMKGSWTNNLIELAEGTSHLASHIREGIVIKTVKESLTEKGERKILKAINRKYLLKDYGDMH